jgi:hypothetical protein
MDYLVAGLKTALAIAVLVLVCVGLPIWGATGSLRQAWRAVRDYSRVMGVLVLAGVLLGALTAVIW